MFETVALLPAHSQYAVDSFCFGQTDGGIRRLPTVVDVPELQQVSTVLQVVEVL
jgi:hypothetical protein